MKFLKNRLLYPLLLSAAQLPAQLPSTDCITTTTVAQSFLEATIIVLVEPNAVHCFSTYTKKWYTLPTSNQATITGHDDHVIIVDGTNAYGFATRFGRFQQITLNGGPTVSGGGGPTHVSIVVDGTTANFFSDLTGSWSSVTFAAQPTIAVNKLVAVATDGTQTVAFGAHHATPNVLNASGVTSISAAGYCGEAFTPGFVHFYSEPRNRWRTEPLSPTATVNNLSARTSIVTIQDGSDYTMWSAFTDTVASVTVSPSAALSYGDHAVLILDDPLVHSFAASQGTIATQSLPGASIAARSSYFVLATDNVDLHAFSGMTGTWSTLPGGATGTVYTNTLSSTAMVISSTAQVCNCFSALTGQWHTSPPLTAPVPYSTYSGGVIADPAGLIGFSAADGSFTLLPGEVPTRTVSFGGNWGCESSTGLHVWNPMVPAWRSHSTFGPVGTMQAHHAALIAQDGISVYFYGSYDDRWTQLNVGTTATIARSDELGWINVGNTYCGIGASGQCNNDSTFPGFWRIMTHGSLTRWYVTAEVGSQPVLALGTNSANLTIPGVSGRLLVDPQSAVLALMPPVPLSGPSVFQWALPDNPAIVGIRLHAQAAIVKGDGIYLTSVYRSTIF